MSRRAISITIGLLAVAIASFLIASGGQADQESQASRAGPVSLDCGNTKAGAKNALRTFVAVLRGGDEQEILSLLAGRKRFFALGFGFGNGDTYIGSGDPREAARLVADYGRFALRIDSFMNADRPSRVTDFGFFGTWNGHRPATGKAAIDCKAGTVIVLGVGVGGDR